MQKYPKRTSRRWEVMSEYLGTGRSVEEVLKATKTVLLLKPDASKAFYSFLEKRKPAASISSPLSTRVEVQGVSSVNEPDSIKAGAGSVDGSSSSCGSQLDSARATTATTAAVSGSDEDTWSAVQERALVQALKTFPKETPQRWDRVAAAVPGKTLNQCKKKFCFIEGELEK